MKISEIETSVTAALINVVIKENEKERETLQKSIEKQISIIGDFYANLFFDKCSKKAEFLMHESNRKQFKEFYDKFEKVGARFSEQIEE